MLAALRLIRDQLCQRRGDLPQDFGALPRIERRRDADIADEQLVLRACARAIVRNVAGLLPFWLVWALMLVNTALCLWPRIPKVRQEAGTFLFHCSFLLVAIGFLLSIALRQESKVRVAIPKRTVAS